MSWPRLVWASALLELQQLRRSRLFVALTVLAALSFLALVSLFGLTGPEGSIFVLPVMALIAAVILLTLSPQRASHSAPENQILDTLRA